VEQQAERHRSELERQRMEQELQSQQRMGKELDA